ncbi:MAG TPA: hemolysin D [Thermoanaerobaculia bacterium]
MRKVTSILALVVFAFVSLPAWSFTQSGVGTAIGNGIPMGHEWITRLAALEVIGGDPLPPDPNDPRKAWGKLGRAKNTDVSSAGAQAEIRRIKGRTTAEDRYKSTFLPIFDAIIGERWVDIGGFNVTKGKLDKYDCWDAVAQEAVEVQYDHFMRRYDDNTPGGGVTAATRSQERFVNYFVAAAMAPPTMMRVWDGGGFSAQVDVDRNYFLFGRAVHLFEDSFSSEHTVRISEDNYERVRQVKAYLCATGAEQHSHKTPTALDFSSGDVIWIQGTSFTSGWGSYKPSFMKPTALVATEATKDLWAAFIRTMGTPMAQREAVARAEAQTLVTNWLSFNDAEMRSWYDSDGRRDGTYVLASGQTGKGVTVSACMNTIDTKWGGDQMKAVNYFAEAQRVCVFNIRPIAGYADLFDTQLHMPFNWEWTNLTWQNPPAGWTIPQRPADTGERIRIKSVVNNQYLTTPDGLNDGSAIVTSNSGPLDLIIVGSRGDGFYRATFAPTLFFSYNFTPGDAKLWGNTTDSNYRLDPVGNNFGIFNFRWGTYFWLNGNRPRLNSQGKLPNANAQWVIERQ